MAAHVQAIAARPRIWLQRPLIYQDIHYRDMSHFKVKCLQAAQGLHDVQGGQKVQMCGDQELAARLGERLEGGRHDGRRRTGLGGVCQLVAENQGVAVGAELDGAELGHLDGEAALSDEQVVARQDAGHQLRVRGYHELGSGHIHCHRSLSYYLVCL